VRWSHRLTVATAERAARLVDSIKPPATSAAAPTYTRRRGSSGRPAAGPSPSGFITEWADRRGRVIDTNTPADTYPTTRLRLVGRGELRDLLGVSYTRAVQLAAQPDFPAPLDELSIGKIWALRPTVSRRLGADITDWAGRKGRAIDLQALPPTTGPDIAVDVDP